MTTTVINREDAQKEVEIFFPSTNETTSVFIQPQSKAKLPPGSEVPLNFQKLNPRIQVVV